MDTLDNSAFDKSGGVSDNALQTLRTTIPWMKFISITGFVVLAFMVVGVLYQLSNSFGYIRYTGLIYIVYFVVGVIIFFLNLFLFQYANNLAHYTRSKQSFDLELALQKQKTLYIVTGVLLIVYILFVVITVLWSLAYRGF